MDVKTRERLAALNQKLERDGLTKTEQAEIGLIYSMLLLELREQNSKLLAELPHNIED